MERRDFIQACMVLLGSSVIPVGCGQGGGDPATFDDFSLPDLSQGRWVDNPETTFSVSHPDFGVIDMELTAIDDEYYSLEAEQFSIVLTGPELPLLDEGKYQVYNASLGYIDLYLQVGDASTGTQNYRAIFSILQA